MSQKINLLKKNFQFIFHSLNQQLIFLEKNFQESLVIFENKLELNF